MCPGNSACLGASPKFHQTNPGVPSCPTVSHGLKVDSQDVACRNQGKPCNVPWCAFGLSIFGRQRSRMPFQGVLSNANPNHFTLALIETESKEIAGYVHCQRQKEQNNLLISHVKVQLKPLPDQRLAFLALTRFMFLRCPFQPAT